MQTALIIVMVAFAIGAAVMVTRGLIVMARGQDVSGVRSNNLMTWRIYLQAGAVLIVTLILWLSRRTAEG